MPLRARVNPLPALLALVSSLLIACVLLAGGPEAVLAALPLIGDFYAGILLVSVFIFMIERNWLRTLLWAAPIFILGNMWTALWVTWRAPEIVRRLKGRD